MKVELFEGGNLLFKLIPYAKNYRKQIILGPVFKFLEAVFELLLPLLLARLIDQGLKVNNPHVVWQMTGLMFFFSITGLLCALVCQYYASIASQGFGTALRDALMHKVNHFSYQQLDEFGADTLITRLTNDINQVQTALAMVIRLLVRAPFLSLGSIVMAFYLNWKIGLIFLVTLPLFICLLYFIIKLSVPMYQKVQETLDHFNSQLGQSLTGVRVIRAFAKQKVLTEKLEKISDALRITYEKVANLSALLSPLTTLILNMGILCILYFGGFLVNDGQLPQGEILALVNYMSQMLLALIIVSNLVVLFTRAEASANRVHQVLISENLLQAGTTELTTPDFTQSEILQFNHVDFRYTPKSGLVLKNIHFALKRGEILGVIGATGSGKSSLIPLILHEYEATKGTVSFYNKDVNFLQDESLKNAIAWVPQKAVLFSGTIRENLAFGKQPATDAECWEALRIAQVADFVQSLPQQLDTPVFEGGQNFSGGQKQRLTIARALIRKPRLLILDDALSALDYQTDYKLRQALKENLQDTALLLISQRVSTLQNAQQILVLAEGQQVGLGTHATLLAENPTYQEIFTSQQEVENA